MTKIDIRDVFRVRIETDEDGFFHLIAEGEDQEVDLAFGHSEAEALYDTVKREIGPWLRERDEARLSTPARQVAEFSRVARKAFACDPDESGGISAAYVREGIAQDMARYGHVAGWREPIYHETAAHAAEAYDPSDPKHPAFHSTHADIWDSREGK